MGVEVLIQDFCRLLAEVASLPPDKAENVVSVAALSKLQQCKRAYVHTHTHTHTHTPCIQETRAQDHDGLTGALFQLGLDGAELAVDDGHHAFDLPWRHRPCA